MREKKLAIEITAFMLCFYRVRLGGVAFVTQSERTAVALESIAASLAALVAAILAEQEQRSGTA